MTKQKRHQKVRFQNDNGPTEDSQLAIIQQPNWLVYQFYRAHLPIRRNSCVMEGKNMQILL